MLYVLFRIEDGLILLLKKSIALFFWPTHLLHLLFILLPFYFLNRKTYKTVIQNIHKVWDDDDSVPRPSDIPNTKNLTKKINEENEDEYLKGSNGREKDKKYRLFLVQHTKMVKKYIKLNV